MSLTFWAHIRILWEWKCCTELQPRHIICPLSPRGNSKIFFSIIHLQGEIFWQHARWEWHECSNSLCLVGWFGVSVTRQLWPWATPQGSAADNIARLKVLQTCDEISTHVPHKKGKWYGSGLPKHQNWFKKKRGCRLEIEYLLPYTSPLCLFRSISLPVIWFHSRKLRNLTPRFPFDLNYFDI